MNTFTVFLLESALNEAVTQGQLRRVEKQLRTYLKNGGNDVGMTFTHHFIEQIIKRSQENEQGERPITIKDVERMLESAIDRYADTMDTFDGKKFAGHFVDAINGLDIPFSLQIDTSKRYNLTIVPKTMIRRGASRVKLGKYDDGAPEFKV